MLYPTKDPRKVFDEPDEPDEEPRAVADPDLDGPVRELEEIHKVFDALGVPGGYAADRIRLWFQHKVISLRANGHQDSCQCQFCGEARVVDRALQKLRAPEPARGR